jgi:hypothetical protein
MIHIDETNALKPLDRGERHAKEAETYPSGV